MLSLVAEPVQVPQTLLLLLLLVALAFAVVAAEALVDPTMQHLQTSLVALVALPDHMQPVVVEP
jgi:uncharacterized membrane protein